jgi:hypothetical protein
MYGTVIGLTVAGSQAWFEGQGLDRPIHAGDEVGAALTAGDFNGDLITDLAIGAPGVIQDSGDAFVLFGKVTGLTGTGSLELNPGLTFNLGSSDPQSIAGDRFGEVLTAGDFHHTGVDNLVVGAPHGSGLASKARSGYFMVMNQLAPGGQVLMEQFWDQGKVEGTHSATTGQWTSAATTHQGNEFAFSLVANDFNGDGFDDLAIGIPFQQVGSALNAGQVDVLYGRSAFFGLDIATHPAQIFRETSLGLTTGANDNFGYSLTAWNFGRNEFKIGFPFPFTSADLAVGIPFRDVGSAAEAGAVGVLYGSITSIGDGLRTTNSQVWTENSTGMPTTAKSGDHFGLALY